MKNTADGLFGGSGYIIYQYYGDNNFVAITDPPYHNIFNLYPNPAKSGVFLTLPEIIKKVQIKIYNLQGILVKQFLFDSNRAFVNIADLSPGLYFLNILADNKIYFNKIIKE
jgi:hypothetical protein